MAEIVANTVVMVTGASAGLGRAIAHALGARGARLGLLAQGWDGLEGARRVEAAGGKALAVPADVSSEDQVEAAARAVENAFGPIDVWVNNAMVSIFSPVKQMTSSEFRRVMDVTYLGCVNGTLATLRRMMPRDKPQPVPPVYQPEIGADAVVWAIEHDNPEVWVGSSTVMAILANRLAPRLLDRYLARTGFAAQQWDGPVEPDRHDNLWEPVAGGHGAHGGFGARARERRRQFWLTRHRGYLSVVAFGLLGSVAALRLAATGSAKRAG